MKMSEKEEKLLDWAVGELKKAPDPVLPEGFLLRFEQKLKQEVAYTQGFTPSQPHWSRSLAAAVLMICCLAAMYWLGPGLPQTSAGELAVAACPGQVLVDGLAVSQVTQLKPSQILETEEEKALLVSSDSRNRVVVGERTKLVVGKKSQAVRTELELAGGSISVSEMTMKIAVRTPELLIVPVGTEYRVDRRTDSTKVAVLSGEVRLESLKPSETVTVRAGESLHWKHGEPLRPSMIEKLGPEQGASLNSDLSFAQRLRRRPELGHPFPNFLRKTSRKRHQDAKSRRAAPGKLDLGEDYPTSRPRRTEPEQRRRSGAKWEKRSQKRGARPKGTFDSSPQPQRVPRQPVTKSEVRRRSGVRREPGKMREIPAYRPGAGRAVRKRPGVVQPGRDETRGAPAYRPRTRGPVDLEPSYRVDVKPPMREIPSYRKAEKETSTRRPFRRSREDFKNRTTHRSRNEDFKNRTGFGRAQDLRNRTGGNGRTGFPRRAPGVRRAVGSSRRLR